MPLENITRHPESAVMLDEIRKIRQCVKGSPFVKAERETYLPHPSALDSTSPQAKIRYSQYIDGAEFDEIPGQTIKSLLGKLDPQQAQVKLPKRLDYLQQDVDGDGVSMRSAIAQAVENVLQVNWQVLVAEYQGLSDLPLTELSKSDERQLNPRATVKQYPRENVIYWHYERINGKMQLSYIMLLEIGRKFDPYKMLSNIIESYLILALDEEGNYYQQKIVKSEGGMVVGERSPVTVKKQPLKWLPVQIVADKPLPAGSLPQELGYLAPICDLTLNRYQVSAEYKEAMRMLPPTTNFYGLSENDWEQFKTINQREYVATGSTAVNVFPGDARGEVLSANLSLEGYERYFEANEAKIRALGGSFPTKMTGDRTATEANIDSAEQTSRLVSIADCAEDAWRRVVLYCGVLEGLYPQDRVEDYLDEVVIELNKDFGSAKISPQEVQQILAAVMQGVIPRDEAIRMMAQGGWTVSDAETLIAAADAGGGMSLGLQGNT